MQIRGGHGWAVLYQLWTNTVASAQQDIRNIVCRKGRVSRTYILYKGSTETVVICSGSPFCTGLPWDRILCPYFPGDSGQEWPGCVSVMGGDNIAKQDTGEDHNLGSGERFISSTPHRSSFYKQSEMSWCQMLSWCKSAEYHRFIPAGVLAPVPQWEGDGGKRERLFLLTAPPTFLLGKYLHMLTNAN